MTLMKAGFNLSTAVLISRATRLQITLVTATLLSDCHDNLSGGLKSLVKSGSGREKSLRHFTPLTAQHLSFQFSRKHLSRPRVASKQINFVINDVVR